MRNKIRPVLYQEWLKQKQDKDAELKKRKDAWTIASRKAYQEKLEHDGLFVERERKERAFYKEVERQASIIKSNKLEIEWAKPVFIWLAIYAVLFIAMIFYIHYAIGKPFDFNIQKSVFEFFTFKPSKEIIGLGWFRLGFVVISFLLLRQFFRGLGRVNPLLKAFTPLPPIYKLEPFNLKRKTVAPPVLHTEDLDMIPDHFPYAHERAVYEKMPLGSARFADFDDLEDHGLLVMSETPPEDLFLAKLDTFAGNQEWLSMDSKNGHLLTVAPSGTGKGVGCIIPNLLTYRGSVVCLDIKGENAMVTARRRRDFGKVFILNPWNVGGIGSNSFNPLDLLCNHPIERQIGTASLMAEKLIYSQKEDHWISAARALVSALLLFVANAEQFDGRRTLQTVFDLVCKDREGLDELFNTMQEFHGADNIVSRQGAIMKGRADSDRSGVLSTVQEQLDFLNDPNLKRCMESTCKGFDLRRLKDEVMSVYLVIPPDELLHCYKWLRLMIGGCLREVSKSDKVPEKSVLFLLDEFASLGTMNEIKQAYGLMRGYGMSLWAIVQDLSQLEELYGKGWESFIENAYAVQFFSASGKTTPEYISAISGQTTQEYITRSVSHSKSHSTGTSQSSSQTKSQSESDSETIGFTWGTSDSKGASGKSSSRSKGGSNSNGHSGTQGASQGETQGESQSEGESSSHSESRNMQMRPLLYPDDIMRMPKNRQVIRVRDMHICISPKIRYYDDPHFMWLADRNRRV